MEMQRNKRNTRDPFSTGHLIDLFSRNVSRAAAYVAPNLFEEAAEPFIEVRSQAARGEQSPRRYVGKANAAAPKAVPTTATGRASGAPNVRRIEPVATTAPRARVVVGASRWSARLGLAVGLLAVVLLALRLYGIATPTIDASTGTEATNAAFVHTMAGQVAGSLDPARLYPPPAPWYGLAPDNPTSGLPLYGWVVALLGSALGAGDWIGRAVASIFALAAGLLLFGVVRQTAGALAGLYSLLFFSLAPLSVMLGQQYSPASLTLALQALAVWSLVRWRLAVQSGDARATNLSFLVMMATGAVAALVDPGSIFLAVLAAYLTLAPQASEPELAEVGIRRLQIKAPAAPNTWRDRWNQSPHRGKVLGYAFVLVGSAALWRLLMSPLDGNLTLGIGDGGGGLGQAVASLLQGGTYVQIVGALMEKLLSIVGLPLLAAGLLRGARRPAPMFLNAWLVVGLVHVLADAGRIARHDDVLLPLILPVCALVGVGSAWAASLPARVWLAITEQRRDRDNEYTVSPQTSWLLDLPEERMNPAQPPRPQAQLAFGKSVAIKAQQAGERARRAWVISVGNLAVLALFGIMAFLGWHTLQARLQPTAASVELAQTGREVAGATAPGSRLIVIGPLAPQIFSASGRSGWAIAQDEFGMGRLETLKAEGAGYMLSTDQDWLGKQADYTGLLSSFSVASLGRNYILFDLNTKPAANDRLYFLESGHTLGGEFRRFWEQHGGVSKLGYPISEEIQVANPLDGQVRRVQFFERAVLEYHQEFAGTPDAVMLAAVGRWATAGRNFARVAPFTSTPDRAYFPDTGHSVKEAFLRYWQKEGGVAAFGYPISEELPEIDPGDGKVYTVQYFERARFEWHPTDAGTANEVQLGLIGKQVYEMQK